MRRLLLATLLVCFGACRGTPSASYLFVWAGDAEHKASDFLGVVDADPASPRYGTIVSSLPTGMAGSHPHHTELEMPAGGHLLANGFSAGRTWLFDLTQPLNPRLLTTFGDLAGYSHPHTYIRLDSGNVLATFQYLSAAEPSAADAPTPSHDTLHGPARVAERLTGGLVELDERGTVIRSGAAHDDGVPNQSIYPYSVLPLPAIDRAISTTTDMDDANTKATSEWLQVWRLSGLTLLRSVALRPGPRGNEHQFTGEPKLLADGKSVYVHTSTADFIWFADSSGRNRSQDSSTDSRARTAAFLSALATSGCSRCPTRMRSSYSTSRIPRIHERRREWPLATTSNRIGWPSIAPATGWC